MICSLRGSQFLFHSSIYAHDYRQNKMGEPTINRESVILPDEEVGLFDRPQRTIN